MKSILILMVLFFSFDCLAHNWTKVFVPGAKCGDGRDYFIYLDKKSDSKLAVEFMAGGACWDAATCFGPNIRTWMYPIPEIPNFSTFGADTDDGKHPLVKHTFIHFPYCTGDVYSAHHIARYFPGVTVYHQGYLNVVLAFKYLQENNILKFQNYKEVVLWGASAGGIGALVHTKTIEPYLNPKASKMVLSDSPGLHFGQDFWQKFPPQMLADFQEAFAKFGLPLDRNSGLVTKYMRNAFLTLWDWKIGVMQGTQDIVMSLLFGNETPWEHERQVMGPDGVRAQAWGLPNVNVWISNTKMHTFLILPESTEIENMEGLSAWMFGLNMMYVYQKPDLAKPPYPPAQPVVYR